MSVFMAGKYIALQGPFQPFLGVGCPPDVDGNRPLFVLDFNSRQAAPFHDFRNQRFPDLLNCIHPVSFRYSQATVRQPPFEAASTAQVNTWDIHTTGYVCQQSTGNYGAAIVPLRG
jgi:hypothetical protein